MILGQNQKKKKKRKPAGTFLIDIICVDSSCICHSLQMNFLLQYISQLKIFVIFFFYKDFHEQIHSRKNIKYNQMQFENRICLDSKFYYIFCKKTFSPQNASVNIMASNFQLVMTILRILGWKMLRFWTTEGLSTKIVSYLSSKKALNVRISK